MKLKFLGLFLSIGAACTACAKADLLAYFNFNNVKLESGSIGVFLESGNREVFAASTRTIAYASAGLKSESALLNLSAFNGEMGAAINGSNANWGVYFGSLVGSVDGFPAGGALALGSGLNGKPAVISLNTEGFQGVKVSFSVRSSAQNGADKIQWEVSTDGVQYKPAATTTLAQNNTYTALCVDLSACKELDNAKQVFIRFAFSGLTGNGNVRLDNIQVSGAKLP